MNTKLLSVLILILIISLSGYTQEDKKPVAENDVAETRVLQTIEIPVLENDFAYNGHPFKVYMVFGSLYGSFIKTDTSIVYTPSFFTPAVSAIDSLSYNIKDLENNLISDPAKVYIVITNDGAEWLNINQVSCQLNAFGMHFWDGSSWAPKYEVPAGSGISSIFNKALWVAGFDESGDLCVSAERYRISGADFFSGPVMDSSSYSNLNDIQWHRVWKLSASEILYHRLHWQDVKYEPVRNILEWPGNGDASAGQASKLAPYYDNDHDGHYDPFKGDFPLIKGDQAIMVINNDDRGPHLETGGRKLGIEVQTIYYAYDNTVDSALKYTTFADQQIINRSGHSYDHVYVGHFLDFDLGYPFDDYIHSDTVLQSVVCYNGSASDGQGYPGEYGEHPPAQSFTCLSYPMERVIYFFTTGAQAMTDPMEDFEYYRYLQGLWKDSTFFTYGDDGYGGTQPVDFIFTGDPVSKEGWNESDSPLGPGDRRAVIISGPCDLNTGDTIHREFAMVFARDFRGNNLSSVALLKSRIHQVRSFYQESLFMDEIPDKQIPINVFPNPCMNELYFTSSSGEEKGMMEITIYDVSGKKIRCENIMGDKAKIIDVKQLKPGIYLLKAQNKTGISTILFIKKE